MIKTSKVVNFFTITTGKQIQYQVVKKFIDIHSKVDQPPVISLGGSGVQVISQRSQNDTVELVKRPEIGDNRAF